MMRRGPVLVLPALAAAGCFGKGSGGKSPAPSAPATAAFELLAPADGAKGVGLAPVFSWTKVPEALGYVFEIAEGSSPKSAPVFTIELPGGEGAWVSDAVLLSPGQAYSRNVFALGEEEEFASENGPFALETGLLPAEFSQQTPYDGAAQVGLEPTLR